MESRLILIMAIVLVASGCAANSTSDTPQNDTQSTPEETQPPQNSSGSEPSNSTDSPVTVTYTDSGFQPKTVTVEQGQTVRWESEASGSMWVASNRHPTHTDYAGTSRTEHCENGDQTSSAFDQCSSGAGFSFTFEKTGEWKYHNHDYSPHQGTVIVE